MRRVEPREFAEHFIPHVNFLLCVFDRRNLLAMSVIAGDVGEHSAALAVRGVLEARDVAVELGAARERAVRVAVQFADL